MSTFSSLSKGLNGVIKVGADKSISHRSLIISAIAIGKSRIYNLLEGEDVLCTKNALELAGVKIEKCDDQSYIVNGVGICGLHEPRNALYLGNSGTSTRLLMGLFAPYDYNIFFTGDISLSNRTMKRVIIPLSEMGARFYNRSEYRLPLVMNGTHNLIPIDYKMDVPSAQVKSAILLAATQILGITTVEEIEMTRDHTERMLQNFGANIECIGSKIVINGGKQLVAQSIIVPADPSSAAFFVVAALITKNSSLVIKNVCMNRTRIGLFEVLRRMGGKIEYRNQTVQCGEDVADIYVESSDLTGIEIEAEIAPRMIDEYPILAIAATFANGKTKMNGLKELVVKESNRLLSVSNGLDKCSIKHELDMKNYSLTVFGNNGDMISGSSSIIETNHDHRIAMSFLVLGLMSYNGVIIDDDSMIATSFPRFAEILISIGGKINS